MMRLSRSVAAQLGRSFGTAVRAMKRDTSTILQTVVADQPHEMASWGGNSHDELPGRARPSASARLTSAYAAGSSVRAKRRPAASMACAAAPNRKTISSFVASAGPVLFIHRYYLLAKWLRSSLVGGPAPPHCAHLTHPSLNFPTVKSGPGITVLRTQGAEIEHPPGTWSRPPVARLAASLAVPRSMPDHVPNTRARPQRRGSPLHRVSRGTSRSSP